MEKKNILVFPCGSEIGLDIYSSVCYSTYFHLIGASSIDDHGRFLYQDYIPGVPYATDEAFIPFMADLVKKRQIDAIYPTMDTIITILKENEDAIGCRIISSSVETTRICLSKELTYKKLENTVLTPRVYDPCSLPRDVFPVFAKPKVGYGGRGTRRLDNQTEVDTFLAGKKDMLLLEFLPGEEYTIDCFTDRNGNLLFNRARKRNRIKAGISVNTFFVDDQTEFEQLAHLINDQIKFRGAWFFQVKRNKEGKLCLLEIASRLGGSSLLSRAIGVNVALLSLFDAFDYPVTISQNDYHVELDRALANRYKTDLEFDAVYCDYDDCMILNQNEINTELVKFLYQCINKKKKIFLLSKHDGNLEAELEAFRLQHLFDGVTHLDKNSDKADFITASRPIFIDDSNAERQHVAKKLGIPVFSPDMIDVLL